MAHQVVLKEVHDLQKGAISFIGEQCLCHTRVLSSFQINNCFVAAVATLTIMHYSAVPAPTQVPLGKPRVGFWATVWKCKSLNQCKSNPIVSRVGELINCFQNRDRGFASAASSAAENPDFNSQILDGSAHTWPYLVIIIEITFQITTEKTLCFVIVCQSNDRIWLLRLDIFKTST